MNLYTENFRIANVSTSHMTEVEAMTFDDRGSVGPFTPIMVGPNGYIVYDTRESVSDESWRDGDDEPSAALFAVMNAAKADGCDYVWFDSDNSVVDGLPVCDWDAPE